MPAAPPLPAPSGPDAPPPRRLTDRAQLDRARARARRQGLATPILDVAAAELQDRLGEVNRSFTDIALVSGFPDYWARVFPAARQVADGERLDLAPGSCDLVIHALALHWADDPVGQIIQCARALRPDGLFLAVLPGGESLRGLAEAMAAAQIESTGGLSPHVLPMGEIRDLGGLLGRAGLALPVADAVPLTLSYRDMLHLGRDLRAMGEGNAMADRLRRPLPRRVIARAAALYAAANTDPGDPARVLARIDLIFLAGWAPHVSQPRALRPGSARMSLADALSPTRSPEGQP